MCIRDRLCTGDVAYQDFRNWSHDPQRQRRFLALPYLVRKAVVAYVRHRSRRAKAQKTEVIMDVDPTAVEAAFYLATGEMGELDVQRGLHRTQMELVAARTSLLNECFF